MTAAANERRRTVAVVLAGGTGVRVGLDTPKQLLKVAGRSLLEHTVALLESCSEVDEILVMMSPGFLDVAHRLLSQRPGGLGKVSRILVGGADRNTTTRNALDALGEQDCNVLVHDAVRPLLPAAVVRDCVRALASYEAVDTAIASADTIIRVDDAGHIAEIPDRAQLRRGQTPQGFRLATIRRAYDLAQADPDFRASDDCGVVLRYLPDVVIQVVPGDEQNMKVTYPIDLYLADRLFQLASQAAPEHDSAELKSALSGRTVVVLGGSYGIGADVARRATDAGAQVFAFSRDATGTYVERPDTVRAALAEAERRTGRVDAVVLSAAQLARGPLRELSDAQVDEQLAINFRAPVDVARLAEPYLRRSRGQLVLFTSSSYTRGRADYALYSATKAAVVNLAQGLADEWADAGIRVNVINPERTRTPMRSLAFGDEPAGSLLSSDVVAATVLDVLASTMTGQVVDVRAH